MSSPVSVLPVPVGVDRVDAREAARDAFHLVSAEADTVGSGDDDIDCRGVVDRGVAALADDAAGDGAPVEVEDVALPDVVPPPSSDPAKVVLTLNVLLPVPPWRVSKPEKVSFKVLLLPVGSK